MTRTQALCEICGEPMPEGEEAFKFHGFSGECPKPPLPRHEVPIAATESRDVDWTDVTGWGAFKGHAIPVDVARHIAEKINLYHAARIAAPRSQS